MAKEAGRELERILAASRLTTNELNYIQKRKEKMAEQCTYFRKG